MWIEIGAYPCGTRWRHQFGLFDTQPNLLTHLRPFLTAVRPSCKQTDAAKDNTNRAARVISNEVFWLDERREKTDIY